VQTHGRLSAAGAGRACAGGAGAGDITFERKTKGEEDFPPAIFSH